MNPGVYPRSTLSWQRDGKDEWRPGPGAGRKPVRRTPGLDRRTYSSSSTRMAAEASLSGRFTRVALRLRFQQVAVALSLAEALLVGCRRRVESKATAPARPVDLIVAKQVGRSAVLPSSESGTEWTKDCQIHKSVLRSRALKRCTRSRDALDAFRVAGLREGERVVVRGPLWIGGPLISTKKKCSRSYSCCNSVGATITVGSIVVDGVGCTGDDSEVCCTAPAFGQVVTAGGAVRLVVQNGHCFRRSFASIDLSRQRRGQPSYSLAAGSSEVDKLRVSVQ